MDFYLVLNDNCKGASHVGIPPPSSSKPDARCLSRWNSSAIFIKIRRKGLLTLEFLCHLHQNPTQGTSHVGIPSASSSKSDARDFSRWSFISIFIKIRRKGLLTLEFLRHHHKNLTQGASHVGISSASSSKSDARCFSRWDFIGIFIKIRRKVPLTLEFHRHLHQNPMQGASHVGISSASPSKSDARDFSRWNFIAIFIKIRCRVLHTLEFQHYLHQNPTQGASHVGISSASSSKSNARDFSRWNSSAIFIKTRRKVPLTLEFLRHHHKNLTQGTSPGRRIKIFRKL